MPASAGRTISAPSSTPAASSSVVTTRMRRRASMAWAPGGSGLGGVPGEGDRGVVALVVVVRRRVERDAEAVAVLLAAGERAQAGDRLAERAHVGERARVLVDVVGVAAGRGVAAGPGAAVVEDDVQLAGERVGGVAVVRLAAGERERAAERAGVGDVDDAVGGVVAGAQARDREQRGVVGAVAHRQRARAEGVRRV